MLRQKVEVAPILASHTRQRVDKKVAQRQILGETPCAIHAPDNMHYFLRARCHLLESCFVLSLVNAGSDVRNKH